MRPTGWWQVLNRHTVALVVVKSLFWWRFNLRSSFYTVMFVVYFFVSCCCGCSYRPPFDKIVQLKYCYAQTYLGGGWGVQVFIVVQGWFTAKLNCVHSLTVSFSGRPLKEAAFYKTFTPRRDFLWSIAIQFFVAIHLLECFPAQWPIPHSPPVLQFALSITLLSTPPHTLILASLHLVGSHCRTRRLLVSSFTGFFLSEMVLNWTSENLWESLFCITHMFSLLRVCCFNL